MHSVIVIILPAFVAQATVQDAMDLLVDKLIDKVFDRGLKTLLQTDLDNTTLAKGAGHFALEGSSARTALAPITKGRSMSRHLPGHFKGTQQWKVSALPCRTIASPGGVAPGILCAAVSEGTKTKATLPGVNYDSCIAQHPPFQGISSAQQYIGTLEALVEAGKMPGSVKNDLVGLYKTYKGAIGKNIEEPAADRETAEMLAAVTERVVMEFKQPFTFPSMHKRIMEPFNHYDFGQRFIGNLIDFDKSFVAHADRILAMQQALSRGENVLLLSNHQSEADPEVWAWMTAALAPPLATEMFYIAGDRVVTDYVAKPFSMGRNLVCVHSKRHIDDDPTTKAAKMATNQRSVRELGKLFKAGGVAVWVAPSGGRDRKDSSGEYSVAKFDPSAVMLLYRMMDKSDKPGHVYPMAMASAEILPPPATVQKDLGEERVMDFRGVGISVAEELDTKGILDGIEDKSEQAEVLSKAAYEKVTQMYKPLADVVYDGVQAGEDFSQPWKA
eukprot:gnl/MRDRNA2_/MRDRNA2_102503_c0_seq1.p1 gnl/MRDRNA2_/MRDRNA2_102503_c0~~gnl/MRDRNA2_/MRDRNA2_102503_c0_seq1.p1  ORF type:complete len:500 (+),score=98.76 gnl/MRDRNA2_/MRDRNA2_102503_c0_seq1:178-1677(+)